MDDCVPCSLSHEPDPETGESCSLCTRAREVVRRINSEIPFHLNEIDVSTNPDLRRRYEGNIPTVFINGKKSFKYRVDEREFRKKIKKEIIKAKLLRFREERKDKTL